MASNFFGDIFRITTWGESHGKAIGVVIDGCPAGLPLSEEEIQQELFWRRPKRNQYVSSRNESDKVEILSGLFEGLTTGAPISIIIFNQDANSHTYESTKNLLRPGHASFTYLEKYGIFDYRGAGRASARETACRVAAGAVAKKILRYHNIDLIAYLKQIEHIRANANISEISLLRQCVQKSPVLCPDIAKSEKMMERIEEITQEGDSVGGIVELVIGPLPSGIGDPVYESLEANLAKAMMSIPAAQGFELGSGFQAVIMKGSQHNDSFATNPDQKIVTRTNFSGGTLGGISTGMPLIVRVAFKPASSIKKPQKTLDMDKNPVEFTMPDTMRCDPCVAIRAVSVVEAMGALVIVDGLLKNKTVKL
ncbi:MAG: chorismate synthase [Parachlamydiales bacterium]|nr:chorismate synthase [Parachlamydiales bacterium]